MEKKYSKIDLAREQLDCAIRLFLEGKYVPSLTLAGAAEEILGKALRHCNVPNALDQRWNASAPIHAALYGKELLWKNFADKENYGRNALKHMRSPCEQDVIFDPEDAAVWMLVRAYENHELLGLPRSETMDHRGGPGF